MYKRMIMGAAALALLAGVAFAAQDATTPPQDSNGQVADNGPPSPPPGDGPDGNWGGAWKKWMGRGHRGYRRGMMGPDGPNGRDGPGGPGPMGMMMQMKGYRMNLGNGVHVAVACGDEPMKDCIASSQTLIDAAKTAAAAQPGAAPKSP